MSYQLLTNSRRECFGVCRKRHWFAYELGLRPMLDAKALRMGSAGHAGLDVLNKGGTIDSAMEVIEQAYQQTIEVDQYEWSMEKTTVQTLVSGYLWRWQDSPLKILASEQSFQLPLVNPETGGRSTVFDLAGKIDGIIELEDGRKAVLEHKFVSDDITIGSDYWRIWQLNHQITLYVYAARQLGFDVATVLMNVIRKPTIKPSPVAIVDDLGAKIVLDRNGNRVKTERGLFRQTGDSEKGYTLQTRPMTCDEWAKKLCNDIGERPDVYFARVEIPRLDSEIAECLQELWEVQQAVREAQRTNRHYRTVSKHTCGFCAYFGLCSSKWSPESAIPEGFEIVTNIHQELEV
jgi:hypothetical protein